MNLMQSKSVLGLMALHSVSLGLVAAEPDLARAGMVYVSGPNNEFGTLDLSSGVFTQISTFSLPDEGGTLLARMQVMGTAGPGTLTGMDSDGVGWTINAATGETTRQFQDIVHPFGGGGTNSILYVYDGTAPAIFVEDFNNNTVSEIGSDFAADGMIVVTPNGHLYYSERTSGFDDLYDLDLATGALTDQGSTGVNNLNVGVYSDGQIYGFSADANGSGGDIVTLSPTTGKATVVGTYSGDIVAAAAFPATVPEPSTLTMLGLGIACVGGALGRRWTA